ncbi:MAG: glycosyltransferase family 4 protein [Patescibacteria group bacterium]|nr:glycosyltransferase family 4 protein [Patescibacteria group bacterium]
MKIFYLITKSEAGGAQTHLADLCRYFKASGHDILVMGGGAGWLKNECANLGVDYQQNKYFSNSPNPFRIFKAIKEIKKSVANFRPDIVHCHSSAAAFLGRWAIKGKIKTVYTAHGWGFNLGMNPFIRCAVLLAEKMTAKYTDAYICVAEFVKQLGLKYRLAPAEKFSVIYNGIEPHALVPRPPTDEIRLSFVGRLAEPKRPELTIKALGLLPPEIKKKIKFIIIGDGPKRDYLVKLAANKGVMIDFRGDLPRQRVFEEISHSDLFIFVSAWEGLPYTILEAMAVGLPVIASDVGGVSEMVNKTNGILVRNDVGQISEAILLLVNNKELRLNLGKHGNAIVAQKFSLAKMLPEVENVYRKI